jgi:hypothetical protein
MLNVVRCTAPSARFEFGGSVRWRQDSGLWGTPSAAHCRICVLACCVTLVKYDFIGMLGGSKSCFNTGRV